MLYSWASVLLVLRLNFSFISHHQNLLFYTWLEFPTGPKKLLFGILNSSTWCGSNTTHNRHFFTPDCVVWAVGVHIGWLILCVRVNVHDNDRKRIYKVHISCIKRETPCEPIPTIFGTLGHLVDIINYAKFHLDRSRIGFGIGQQKDECSPY